MLIIEVEVNDQRGVCELGRKRQDSLNDGHRSHSIDGDIKPVEWTHLLAADSTQFVSSDNTFRATGITAYLSNGGTLEHAQQIAAHAFQKTTKLHDRTADTISLEIERRGLAGVPTGRLGDEIRLPIMQQLH